MPPKGGKQFDVGKMLVDGKFLSADDLARAKKTATARKADLKDVLIEDGIITADLFGQAMAERYGVPYADLNSHIPSAELAKRIPAKVAQKWRAVVFREAHEQVIVATDHPDAPGLLPLLQKGLKSKKVTIAYGLTRDIDTVLSRARPSLDTRIAQYGTQGGIRAPILVDELFEDALVLNASDIHLEPQPDHFLVRFRVDGVMQTAATLHKELHAVVVNRIKVLGRMRLDDHFTAQDGAIRHRAKTQDVDVRVSIVPTLEGEKVVMRLLTGAARTLALSDLGLSERNREMLRDAIRKPFGMILTTGPTGSGKTTTLYAALKTLDWSALNITTIEEPVEYRLVGINQIQVNARSGLTFDEGLRSIVRQNPDVIMVGEIRDKETAEISVNAALTGHLLFSTFHANDAATAVVRLMDIGVQEFLLSSTLELLMAQRLARKICEACRVSKSFGKNQIKDIAPGAEKILTGRTVRLYEGKGCSECNGVGYRGRIGLFELIAVTAEIRELILRRPSSQDVWRLARSQGARSLFEDGIDKARAGITTLEEVSRVSSASD